MEASDQSTRSGDGKDSARNQSRAAGPPSTDNPFGDNDACNLDIHIDQTNGQWAWLNGTQRDEEVPAPCSAKISLPKDRPWTCPACTFVNKNPLHLACAVCGTSKEPDQVPLEEEEDNDDIEKQLPQELGDGDAPTTGTEATVSVDVPEIFEDSGPPLSALQDIEEKDQEKNKDVKCKDNRLAEDSRHTKEWF